MIRAADDSDFMISVRLPQKKGITVYRTMYFIKIRYFHFRLQYSDVTLVPDE